MNKIRNFIVVVVFIAMLIGFFLLYHFILINHANNNSVKLTDKIDPDIVLVNIGKGDRAFII